MSSEAVAVAVSSLVLNSVNFLLFDLLLAAAVYYLTADVAGLVNSISALKGKGEAIALYSPAFFGVGVGITCTRKHVFYVLAFLRIVSVLFIFISSMSFIGGTQCVVAEKEANVVWLGNFSTHEDAGTLQRRALLRQSCQGQTNSTLYYGELRDDGFCELDLSRIGRTVHFDFFYGGRSVNFTACRSNVEEISGYSCDTQVEDYIILQVRANAVECHRLFNIWKTSLQVHAAGFFKQNVLVWGGLANTYKLHPRVFHSVPDLPMPKRDGKLSDL